MIFREDKQKKNLLHRSHNCVAINIGAVFWSKSWYHANTIQSIDPFSHQS